MALLAHVLLIRGNAHVGDDAWRMLWILFMFFAVVSHLTYPT